MKRFGFIASDELVGLIIAAKEALESDEKDMYVHRNRLIEKVSDELIEKMILDISKRVSDPERQESIRSLGKTVNSVVSKVVKVMLSKDKNKVVMQSKPFLEKSVARDADGRVRMGFAVPEEYYTKQTGSFKKVADGDNSKEILEEIKAGLKELDEMLLGHFIVDFVQTLGWGAIKMNLAKGTKLTISKANSIMVDKMITKLKLEQLQELLPHFADLLFESDIVGLDVLK